MRTSLNGLTQAHGGPSPVAAAQVLISPPLAAAPIEQGAAVVSLWFWSSAGAHVAAIGCLILPLLLLLILPRLLGPWTPEEKQRRLAPAPAGAARRPAQPAALLVAGLLLVAELALVLATGSLALMADLGFTAGDLAACLTAHMSEKAWAKFAAAAPADVTEQLARGGANLGTLLAAGATLSAALSAGHRLLAAPGQLQIEDPHFVAPALHAASFAILLAGFWPHVAPRVLREAVPAAEQQPQLQRPLGTASPDEPPAAAPPAWQPRPAPAAKADVAALAASTGPSSPRTGRMEERCGDEVPIAAAAALAPIAEALEAIGSVPPPPPPFKAEAVGPGSNSMLPQQPTSAPAQPTSAPAPLPRLARDVLRSCFLLVLCAVLWRSDGGAAATRADAVGALVVGAGLLFCGAMVPLLTLGGGAAAPAAA